MKRTAKITKSQVSKKDFSIYDYDQRLQRTWKLIKKELSFENVELIEKYEMTLIREQLAKATRLKNLERLLSLSRKLGKNWADATQNDVDLLVKTVVEMYGDSRGKETNSSADHKRILKIFFRWMKLGSRSKEDVGDPSETKGIKIKKVPSSITREDLITPEEREWLIDGCNGDPRDEALVDCSLDAGPRAGELLNCRTKHVVQDKYGFILKVDGKMGPRPLRIIKASPRLARWLSIHPLKKDRQDPALWPQLTKRNYGDPLSYFAARKILQKARENARKKHPSFTKRVFFTLNRHSNATNAANFMTPGQMEQCFGWSKGSDMPKIYTHLNNNDADEALLRHYNLKSVESEDIPQAPKNCSICEMPNDPKSEMCSKCGKPLDLQTAIELEEQEKEKHTSLKSEVDKLKEKLAKKEKEDKQRHQELLDMIKNEHQKGVPSTQN